MRKRPHAIRRIRPDVRPALTKYTSLIGEVTFAYNALHAGFFLAFTLVVDVPDSPDMSSAMWHTLRSDEAQRALLRAAASESNALGRWKRGMMWVIDSAGRLAEYRNDAIHTIFEYGPDGKGGFAINPSDWSAPPKRFEKLERVGYRKLFKLLIGDFNALTDYLAYISGNLIVYPSGVIHEPLPRRPRLQSIQHVQRNPPASNSPR
jgi:hypothetical protein